MCHSIYTVAHLAPPLDPTVAAVIADYCPSSVGSEAAAFARSVVATVAPASRSRAKALLWACAKLAAFGQSVGLEGSPEVLLHPSVIERLMAVGCGNFSAAGKRTLRTNLRYVAARMARGDAPSPASLPRERAKAPYTEAEVAAYLALASAQPTCARRHRATGLICLGAGAGLIGADLRTVRGADVICRSGGVVVTVDGRRPRVVPVLARYQTLLLASASLAGEGYLIGRVDPNRHNVTTPLISSLSGGSDLPRLSTARLRSTWLAGCANALGLKAFMEAAGVVCSQRLGDLVAGLPVVDEETAVTLLGGRR
jgi:integrase